jgi:hypothetical protein
MFGACTEFLLDDCCSIKPVTAPPAPAEWAAFRQAIAAEFAFLLWECKRHAATKVAIVVRELPGVTSQPKSYSPKELQPQRMSIPGEPVALRMSILGEPVALRGAKDVVHRSRLRSR